MAGSRATAVRLLGSRPTSCAIEDGKLAEHWDVLQDEATKADSVSGLPMFGDPLSLLIAISFKAAKDTTHETLGQHHLHHRRRIWYRPRTR